MASLLEEGDDPSESRSPNVNHVSMANYTDKSRLIIEFQVLSDAEAAGTTPIIYN